MATATIFSAAGDGLVRNSATGSTSGSWTTLRNASTGTLALATDANIVVCQASNNSFADGKQYVDRGYFAFDLSSIPAASTITAATLNLHVTGVTTTAGGAVCVVAGSQASTSTLATTDFGNVGSTEYATRVNFSAITNNAYNILTLNATGIAALQSGIAGFVKLALRSSFDLDDSMPTASQASQITTDMSEQTGTTSDPFLSVTYGAIPGRRTTIPQAVMRAATR